MKLKIYTIVLIISFLFVQNNSLNACGFYYSDWDVRPLAFRAFLPQMYDLQPFWYTPTDLYYSTNPDPLSKDLKRNLEEWKQAVSEGVSVDDIYNVLYDSDYYALRDSYEKSTLPQMFENSNFIEALLKPKNKEILKYLLFAKEVESTGVFWDYWDDRSSVVYISSRESKIRLLKQAQIEYITAKSEFLRNRYAFQVVRLAYQVGELTQAVYMYKLHFKSASKNNLMSAWAALFCAMSLDFLDQKSEANRFYIQAFNNCDSKKFRAVQLYNKKTGTTDTFTNKDKSIDIVIHAINYPGRSLDQIKEVCKYDRTSEYLPFLVMREVLKIEDWMMSSVYQQTIDGQLACVNDSSVFFYRSYYDFKNKTKDREYILEVKGLIIDLLRKTLKQDEKDFYNIALSHLNLLEGNNKEANKYLAQISVHADKSILLQKEIEQVWISINTEDVTTESFKNNYLKRFRKIKLMLAQEENKIDNPYNSDYADSNIFRTLNASLAKEFFKKGDVVSMCLLTTTYGFDEKYPEDYTFSAMSSSYYSALRLFDLYASTSDIDKLIALIKKKNKTKFEQYICNQPFNSIDSYKDLKGTIAVRNLDFETAYLVFASMDQNFWANTYEYATYLAGDPFVPSSPYLYADVANTSYKFTKTKFVKDILTYQKKTKSKNKDIAAKAYLKLGHAYNNMTFWGDFWMMMSYGWGSGDAYTFITRDACTPNWRNYYESSDLAYDQYNKAYELAKNKEIKAYATIMALGTMPRDKSYKDNVSLLAKEYYDNLEDKTKFGRLNKCLLYEAFLW